MNDVRRYVISAVATALLMLLPTMAQAHPHGWVDYRIKVHFDDQQRVTALEQVWTLDPIYSLTLLEELSREQDMSMDHAMARLGSDITANLARQHYLTHVYHKDSELAVEPITSYHVQLNGKRIEYTFTLPLETPQAVGNTPLTWQVYDDSYYIEFLYDDTAAPPIALLSAPANCTSRVSHAAPPPSLVADLSSIDVNGEAPDGIGRHLADTGILECPDA